MSDPRIYFPIRNRNALAINLEANRLVEAGVVLFASCHLDGWPWNASQTIG